MVSHGFVLGDRRLNAVDSHADWCAAYGELGPYRFIGASAIGKWHLREGRPREDAFAIRTIGAWIAIAVSDGVGSRPNSRYGASFAVEALCEHLAREALGEGLPPALAPSPAESEGGVREGDSSPPREERGRINLPLDVDSHEPLAPSDARAFECGTLYWHRSPLHNDGSSYRRFPTEEMVRRAFRNTRRDLEQFAGSRTMALSEVSCTLLGMVLDTETGAVAVGQIGDGCIAWSHPSHGAQPIVEAPLPGEVGETYVLTQSDWETHLAVRACSPEEAAGARAFYVMTDGVADDCTYPPPDDIFHRWAQDMDREMRKEEPLPQKARRLLRWLATYEVKGSWDDRTLVVVWRI